MPGQSLHRHNREPRVPGGSLQMTQWNFPAVLVALMFMGGCTQTEPQPSVVVEPESAQFERCPEVVAPACPEPEVVEKVVIKEVPAPLPPMATTAGKKHLPIVGGVEWAVIDPPGIRMEARMDSGLETSVMHAENIKLVEMDGKKHIRFNLIDPDSPEPQVLELPLRRTLLLKQASGEPEQRYVVRLSVGLGDSRARIDVALADRKKFEYRVLLGRNFLIDTVIVDVSRTHLLAPLAASH